MGTSYEDLKARKTLRTKTVAVAIDEDLMRQIADLESAIPVQEKLDEQENKPNRAPKLRQQLETLREQADHVAEEFTFRELPRPTMRDLIAAHPDPDGKLRWNEDTFAPALLHATCTSHDWTPDQWQEAWTEWGGSVTFPLFATAYDVCDEPSKVPFGWRKSGGIRDSEPNSDTADLEGSDIQSS